MTHLSRLKCNDICIFSFFTFGIFFEKNRNIFYVGCRPFWKSTFEEFFRRKSPFTDNSTVIFFLPHVIVHKNIASCQVWHWSVCYKSDLSVPSLPGIENSLSRIPIEILFRNRIIFSIINIFPIGLKRFCIGRISTINFKI